MARYVVQIRSPKPPDEAFAYMADLTNFASWDPGVLDATQVEGSQPGPDAAFDVEVKGFPRPLTLRYRLTTYEPPVTVVARAESTLFTSVDTITVEPAAAGSIVTYDADLTLNGPLGLADPLLGLAFDRIAGRAADGLERALEGERIHQPA